jgi:hypothetical protein
VTRLRRRCSPTASTLSDEASSITVPRGIVAAGAEEPNALVQLARGAGPSPTRARRCRSSTTD